MPGYRPRLGAAGHYGLMQSVMYRLNWGVPGCTLLPLALSVHWCIRVFDPLSFSAISFLVNGGALKGGTWACANTSGGDNNIRQHDAAISFFIFSSSISSVFAKPPRETANCITPEYT